MCTQHVHVFLQNWSWQLAIDSWHATVGDMGIGLPLIFFHVLGWQVELGCVGWQAVQLSGQLDQIGLSETIRREDQTIG